MRRVGGLLGMMALALVLVACGGESNDEPTAAATVTVETAPPTVMAPVATPPTLATPPVPAPSTPVVSPEASPVASPIASPVASPVASPIASPIVAASPVVRTSWNLEGTISLPGTENERFVLGSDGCVGLGKYAGVQAGQQVVVKDASGTVIGVTTLAATSGQLDCIWTFDVEVPVSDFYIVSMPLLFERVYTDVDITVVDGRLQITLP